MNFKIMIDGEPNKNNTSVLREDIGNISGSIAAEMTRTGQPWLVCLGSPIQVISADITIIEQSGQMTGESLERLKAEFQKVVSLWKTKKKELAEAGREISEEEKQELIQLINVLAQTK